MVKVTGAADGFLASKFGDFTATYADQNWVRATKGKRAGEVAYVVLTYEGLRMQITRKQTTDPTATGWTVTGNDLCEDFASIVYAADCVELAFADYIENGRYR